MAMLVLSHFDVASFDEYGMMTGAKQPSAFFESTK